jgi:hypothetical protein
MTLQIVSWLRRVLSRSDTFTSSSGTHPLVSQIRQLRRRRFLFLTQVTALYLALLLLLAMALFPLMSR